MNTLTPEGNEIINRIIAEHDQATLAMNWRTIETAPKDGRMILVVGGRYDRAHIVNSDGDYWAINHGRLTAIPTHWMPLPEPPRRAR